MVGLNTTEPYQGKGYLSIVYYPYSSFHLGIQRIYIPSYGVSISQFRVLILRHLRYRVISTNPYLVL